MRTVRVATLILLLISTIAFSQEMETNTLPSKGIEKAEKVFTKDDYLADWKQLRQAITTLHPATYAFTSKEEFEAFFNNYESIISDKTSFQEFYINCSKALELIGCGHSRLSVPPGYWQRVQAKFFPLILHFERDKAFVIECQTEGSPIPKGSEILSINGRNIGEIIADLLPLVTSDGRAEGSKLARLTRSSVTLYYFLSPASQTFDVEFRALDSRDIRTISLEGISFEDLHFSRATPPFLNFRILDETTALISIKSFSFYNDRKTFNAFIDHSFKNIAEKNIKNVIFDFQGNSGGDPFCTAHLLSYIIPRPFPYFSEIYGEEYAHLARPIPLTKTNHFKGNLFYLIDSNCFSSTGHLAALLKYHNIGKLVGSETGGTYTCNDATAPLQLTNTGISVFLARHSFAVAVENIPRKPGIKPDFPQKTSIEDIIKGRNAALDKALELIKESR